jgi:hypothetical protein
MPSWEIGCLGLCSCPPDRQSSSKASRSADAVGNFIEFVHRVYICGENLVEFRNDDRQGVWRDDGIVLDEQSSESLGLRSLDLFLTGDRKFTAVKHDAQVIRS